MTKFIVKISGSITVNAENSECAEIIAYNKLCDYVINDEDLTELLDFHGEDIKELQCRHT